MHTLLAKTQPCAGVARNKASKFRSRRTPAWLALLTMLLLGAAPVCAKTVGTTKDACDGHKDVTFLALDANGASAKITVHYSATREADLPGLVREITWYCAGSRERSANDELFNHVKLARQQNGAMLWTFSKVEQAQPAGVETPPASGAPKGLTRMGESNDACDKSRVVAFSARNKERVELGPLDSRLVELPGLVRDLHWTCDKSNERVANPNEFNWVQVERAGNGAIHWIFYRSATMIHPSTVFGKPSAADDASLGDFLHNVPGNIVLGRGGTSNVTTSPGLLKSILDGAWDSLRPLVQSKIRAGIHDKRVTLGPITLAPAANNSELRIAEDPATVIVKYVVHGNTASGSVKVKGVKPDPNFKATVDAELVLLFPRSQQVASLAVSSALAFAHHIEIAGDDPGSAIQLAFGKSRVRAFETQFGNSMSDITKEVNVALKGGLPFPAAFPLVFIDADEAGNVLLCMKKAAQEQCTFPVARALVDTRQPIGNSKDQCSAGKIWMWDVEKGRFLAIARGSKGTVVELDNRRFEWFCGGGPQPDAANDEWASGDPGTFAVRVSREAEGSEIRWEFLSWH